jgi:multiple sugar transport system substrate-binding protein
MVEIELSYTWGSDEPVFTALVEEFNQQNHAKVHLRRLDWSTAWVDLFTMVSQGHGSDVSSIGSTWVSTLAKLDALRPYKPDEVSQMGGATAFVAPAWQNAKLVGDQRVWSIPWVGWMYLIFYRKDLLESVGIDPSNAFDSPQAVQNTLATLKASSLEIPWLNADIPHPHIDFLHMAASWVWAAGGEFINSTGNKALFDSPQAMTGFTNWLNTHRAVREQHQYLSVPECRDLVRQGRAAASLVDINTANTIIDTEISNIKREDIGFSNITNIPWMGGGSFVIWEHTQIHPDRERAAVELVKFLTRKEASRRWMQQGDLLPLRMDALAESYAPGNPLHETVMLAARQGRSYYNVSHWRRVEAQLALELGAAVKEVRQNPSADSATVLRTRLEPLARRLNIVLEQ